MDGTWRPCFEWFSHIFIDPLVDGMEHDIKNEIMKKKVNENFAR